MKREKLKKLKGERRTFQGIFVRYGIKHNWHGFPVKTLLFKDISNGTGIILTDHIWFNMTKGFEKLGELNEGDLVQFDARIREYVKGYVNYRKMIDERSIDYRLSHPTKIMLVNVDFKKS
ncbi:MAG: hypothetical protein ACXAC6_17400 [Candidatus Hodarchaeales archaeon]|jgi:hypothetical protein